MDPFFIPYTKVNLKWIKDLNVRPENIKPPEENKGSKLLDIGLSNDFFGLDTKSKGKERKINTWGYFKLKIFCTAKETINNEQ